MKNPRSIIKVRYQRGCYDVITGHSIVVKGASEFIGKRRAFLLLDGAVERKHSFITEIVKPGGILVIPGGERSKSPGMLLKIWRWLAKNRADRHDLLVVAGGGAVLDIGAFSASTWMRGIDHLMIPTTLLAMADASVGGKTGLNIPEGKNLAGTFHQPAGVIADTCFLSSLPARQIRSGLAEIIKTAVIGDPGLQNLLPEKTQTGIINPDLIHRSIEFKAQIVSSDERETGLRKILNYGHTLGHALEKSIGFGRVTHGEAVAVGMDFAARLGIDIGETAVEVLGWQRQMLRRCGLYPFKTALKVNPQDAASAIASDKKACGDWVDFIFVRTPGEPVVKRIETALMVSKVLEYLKEGNSEGKDH